MIITNISQSNTLHKVHTQEGIALLIALLVMGVLFGISSSLLNITLKQYQLSGIAFASETAFQAANAGIECALYHDWVNSPNPSVFDVPSDGSEQTVAPVITCMDNLFTFSRNNISNLPLYVGDGDEYAVSGEEQQFTFNWPSGVNPEACVEISVYKFSSNTAPVPKEIDGVSMGADCGIGNVCTIIQSRGYNVECAERNTSARVVEREFTQVY